MISYLRRKAILEEMEIRELMYLDDFSALLPDTSRSTIRRDLQQLRNEGKIELLHGGAARRLETSSYDMPLISKQQIHTAEKEILARYAASLVADGEVIYMDSGTTPLPMIPHLRNKKIQIVTSNIMILFQLEDTQFTCHILGGEVEKTLGSVVGPVTDNLLRDMFFDKSFIGCTGISSVYGVTTPNFREASKKRIVMEHSGKTYVLADSSKLGKKSLCKAFDASRCTLITNADKEELTEFENYLIAGMK